MLSVAELADLRARLEAAERVVEAARAVQKIGTFANSAGDDLSPRLSEALSAYDALRARGGDR